MLGEGLFYGLLPFQQRGTAPALPISGSSHAIFPSSAVGNGSYPSYPVTANNAVDHKIYATGVQPAANVLAALNSNTVDLSTASTFDIAALRLATQVQHFRA